MTFPLVIQRSIIDEQKQLLISGLFIIPLAKILRTYYLAPRTGSNMRHVVLEPILRASILLNRPYEELLLQVAI